MIDLLQHILDNPLSSLLVIGNLVIIESLLSVDNAAVLATMVMDLPAKKRAAALKYGIIGAYFFRGLCLYFASYLVQIWWLKPLGGFYLLYLVWAWLKGKKTPRKEDDYFDKQSNLLYRWMSGPLGAFWSTVLLIEMMDLAFSIDNIFAAVAFTDNLILICVGVFIGILAMRFVAQGFVGLMERYPFLESCAFVVIGLLGLKLSLSGLEHFYPQVAFIRFMEGPYADIITSGVTVAIFVVPVLVSVLLRISGKEHSGCGSEKK
jgi:YkoY family integral membrane protein